MTSVKTNAPAYFLGEKSNFNSLNLLVGTNDLVGPGAYKPEENKKTSIHQNPPKWTLPKDKRKGLNLKKWTIQECYYVYRFTINVVLLEIK